MLVCAVLLGLFFCLPPTPAVGKSVTDLLGRQVRVPENPRRVIAMAPSVTEIVFALGCEHKLAGVTQFSDFPARANALPKIGSYVHLDLEKIVSLNP